MDVCGAAHEGHGDVVKIVLYGKFEIAAVPGGEAWQGHVHAGHIDAFVVAQHAAGNYAAKNVCAGQVFHLQFDQSVVEQDAVADMKVLGQGVIGDGYATFAAGKVPAGQGKAVAGSQSDRPVCKCADTDFRAFGVQNGGYGDPLLPAGRAQLFEHGQMARMAAVGEVEPGGVHAAAQQGAEHGVAAAGRAERADDFCFSHHALMSSFRETGMAGRLCALLSPLLVYPKKYGSARVRRCKNDAGSL